MYFTKLMLTRQLLGEDRRKVADKARVGGASIGWMLKDGVGLGSGEGGSIGGWMDEDVGGVWMMALEDLSRRWMFCTSSTKNPVPP